MSTPILSTKLYIPPLHPNLTPRPRLIERLDKGLRDTPGVTLISAPAGFGKTTLVNEWLRQSDLCTAWLSLEETDNDPARFLTYLVAALEQISDTIDHIGQGTVQTPQPAPSEALLTVLINEIAATSTQFVLVLDDYHVIKTQSIHHALTFLLEHLPSQMRLVIICRADPPLPLARWRGRGQLTELREADLRFTSEEAATFVPRSTPSAGQALRPGPPASSQEILEYLESSNLFIVPLDDKRRWYRYHHLFADLLHHRLRQNFPDQLPVLHRRASKWYEQNGLLAEAVGHALAAADFEWAATLIEQVAWEVLIRGEMVMLLSWLDRLPSELARFRPQLAIFHAWALALTGQPDAAESYLQDIDAEGLQGEVAAARAYVAFLQQDSRAIELSRQALEHLPEQDFFLRSIMALSLGTATYWTLGDPVAAGRALTEAVSLGRAAGDSYLVLPATSTLGQAQQMQGQLHRAAETYRQALELAAVSVSQQVESRGSGGGQPAPFAGLAYTGLAGLLYEWNNLDGAQHHALKGIDLGERGQSVDVLEGGRSYLTLAQVYQARGEVDKALELIQKAERFAQSHNQAYVVTLATALRARLALAQGNVAAASWWVQKRGLSANDELSYARETEYITLAQILMAQGQAGEALGLLARLLAAAKAAERIGSAIKILALEALTFQAQSDGDRAMSALEEALSLAEPEGYVRTFVDEAEEQRLSPDYRDL